MGVFLFASLEEAVSLQIPVSNLFPLILYIFYAWSHKPWSLLTWTEAGSPGTFAFSELMLYRRLSAAQSDT